MSIAPARTMPLASPPTSCDLREDRRARPLGELGQRGGRVGGAQDDVIERQLHAVAGYGNRGTAA